VVITAVARDDLPDHGAAHFAECVRRVRGVCPETSIEVLPADFRARRERIALLCEARPDIYNHNLEVVERLTRAVRPQAGYDRSLDVLAIVKQIAPDMLTKSGLMVGLGETEEEVLQTCRDLREVGCDILTIGQYLQPAAGRATVEKYYTPAEFGKLARASLEMGFLSVAAGPFVRSSYNAGEVFEQTRRGRVARSAASFDPKSTTR
jgi:lipoic acid synthetase